MLFTINNTYGSAEICDVHDPWNFLLKILHIKPLFTYTILERWYKRWI